MFSNRRTLKPYLDKYGMTAELIPQSDFLHPVHCGLVDGSGIKVKMTDNDGKEREEEIQPCQFGNIHMIKICLKV